MEEGSIDVLSPPPTCTPSRPPSAPRWCCLSVCGQRGRKEEESAQGSRREKAGGGEKEAAAVVTLGDVPCLRLVRFESLYCTPVLHAALSNAGD